MKHTVLSLILFFATTAWLAAADFNGAWSGKLHVGALEMPAYFVLSQSGGKLTGTTGPSAGKQVPLRLAVLEGERAVLEASPNEGRTILRFVLASSGARATGQVFENGREIGTVDVRRVAE